MCSTPTYVSVSKKSKKILKSYIVPADKYLTKSVRWYVSSGRRAGVDGPA